MIRLMLCIMIFAGCGGPATGPDPELTGCATDENWRTFDDQEKFATVDPTQSPSFTQPAGGATVDPTQKPVVRWQRTPTDPGTSDGDVSHPAGGPFSASIDCMSCCSNFTPGALTTMHLPPISGDAFDLHFTVGGSYSYRVVTTLQEWTPPDDVWAGWRGRPIKIEIWRLDLLKNDVKTGPFTSGQPLTFTVGK